MAVRPVSLDDASQIVEIYNHYIITSYATFEVEPIDVDEMSRRVEYVLGGGYPFFVCEMGNEIVGYAYGHQYRPRHAYRHSVETTVYLKQGHDGKNIGTELYEKLFSALNTSDFHAIVAGISLPNDASVRLHERFGMEKVAHFREVGHKFDQWIDVGYWEIVLHK